MKHVLITGSTRGIGFGLAKRFIEAGLKVTINGTTETNVTRAVRDLKELYPDKIIQGFVADVSNINEIEVLWEKATRGLGPVTIWINNAGVNQTRKFIWEIDSQTIDKVVKTNITGVINGSIIAFTKMAEQGGGQIYNMEGFGSDGMMMKNMTLYGTTKRAVRYFTQSMAKEAKNSSVQIGTLSPGMVLTDFLLNSLKANPKEAEKNKKVFNILADNVETVTLFLSHKVLMNTKNNAHIAWLTKQKVIYRFMKSLFVKRDLFR
jgi:short-subunit dehydrogenase